jgi:hypothetical protein
MEKVILLISDVFNIYHAVFAFYTHTQCTYTAVTVHHEIQIETALLPTLIIVWFNDAVSYKDHTAM